MPQCVLPSESACKSQLVNKVFAVACESGRVYWLQAQRIWHYWSPITDTAGCACCYHFLQVLQQGLPGGALQVAQGAVQGKWHGSCGSSSGLMAKQ
jgi:hypothetical protein